MAKRQAHTIRFPVDLHDQIADDHPRRQESFNQWVVNACLERLGTKDAQPLEVEDDPFSGDAPGDFAMSQDDGDVTEKSIADFVREAQAPQIE